MNVVTAIGVTVPLEFNITTSLTEALGLEVYSTTFPPAPASVIPYPAIVVGLPVRSEKDPEVATVARDEVLALAAIEFVTVVLKFASSPNADASSLRVSNVPGAASIKLLTCVVT